jgi:beta-N-acetylhexosaminidase
VTDKKTYIDGLISRMTLEQKVGQCLVIGFVGTMVTPAILHRIRTFSPAGIRAGLTFRTKDAVHDPYAYNKEHADRALRKQKGTVKDLLPGVQVHWCTNEEYCLFLNVLKAAALENGLGIPLHVTLDMEGDASADYFRDGIRFFPSPMGIAATGDPGLAHDVALATSAQLVPLGFDWIHSPVLDVNTNPLNPEIGSRSYGESAAEVLRYGREALRGFREGGLITTGKHFPGRGASSTDAHGHLPEIALGRKEMETHLAAFQGLIDAGLPAIMSAHTTYPALDPSGTPASLSAPILTGLLKGEMGFTGAITTDDITMGGIVEKLEVAEACVRALNAGNDLVLIRDESSLVDEVYEVLVDAARKKRIPEERLDDALRRSLSVKYDYGLFRKGGLRDEAKAGKGIADRKVIAIASRAARATVTVLRDEAKVLPLPGGARVLLVEQIHPLHRHTNTQECHPGLLWETMLRHSPNVAMVETSLEFSADEQRRVTDRIGEADVIVITNYYLRRFANGNEFVRRLARSGKPVVVVANTPYPQSVLPEYRTVVLNYGASPESFAEVARILFGGATPSAPG